MGKRILVAVWRWAIEGESLWGQDDRISQKDTRSQKDCVGDDGARKRL